MPDILYGLQKPGRYIGGEKNFSTDLKAPFSFAYVFPEPYEIAFSNIGLQILINEYSKYFKCDYAFMPGKDFADAGFNIKSLNFKTPLKDFDVIGFSLHSELSFTNILKILQLSGIPLLSKDRKEGHPLVIAGGSIAQNPYPLFEIMDAFIFGDGENTARFIKETLTASSRLKRLEKLNELSFSFAPSIDADKKAVPNIFDINSFSLFPPVIPNIRPVQERLNVEISRGCAYNCKFCQASKLYSPLRHKSAMNIKREIKYGIEKTGYDKIGLLSLNSSSYPEFKELLKDLIETYKGQSVSITVPSQRVEKMDYETLKLISSVRRSGLTLAPETGDDSLRKTLNKNFTNADMIEVINNAALLGWRTVKIYFMIGLPGETFESLKEISRLLNLLPKKIMFNVTISPFVPKPFTPFENEKINTLLEFQEKINFLKSFKLNKNIRLKFHNPFTAQIEYILSSKTAISSEILTAAFKKGCFYDNWSEYFKKDEWRLVLEDAGII